MLKKIKILPIFIICACLMFSVKVGNIVKKDFSFSVFANQAISQETPEVEDISFSDVDLMDPQTSFSEIEVEILQDLASRREVLDAKANELEKRTFQLDLAKEEIDKKIEQMKDYEKRLTTLVNKYNKQEEEKTTNLIKVYTSMKPKDAAEIFNNLDSDALVLLFSYMKPSSSSAILSQMDPKIAKEITLKIMGNSLK